jgi:hypothetical protein
MFYSRQDQVALYIWMEVYLSLLWPKKLSYILLLSMQKSWVEENLFFWVVGSGLNFVTLRTHKNK